MAKTPTDEKKLQSYKQTAQEIKSLYIDTEFNHQDEDFEILSTIRYDPLLSDTIDSVIMFDGTSDNSKLFFLFDEHLHRINLSLNYFQFGYELTRDQLLQKLNEVMSGLDKSYSYKLRITINKQGDATVTAQSIQQRYNLLDGFNSWEDYFSPVWNVYIDSEPIWISPFTSFKTTRRQRYNEARERSLIKDSDQPQEVLLYNTSNQITEGSITNIAIKDPKLPPGEINWITPMLTSGCLCGVVRHMLIAKRLITEKQISLKDVNIGDEILLFNGIIGVVKGRVTERPTEST